MSLFFCVFCSSKRDNELLLKLLGNLNMVLKDDSVNVVKKAILTLTQLYKVTLQVYVILSWLKMSFKNFFSYVFKIKRLL